MLPVRGQTTARDDAVQMGMEKQVLAPGVEKHRGADLGAEVPRIGGDRAECGGCGAEEDGEEDLLVA